MKPTKRRGSKRDRTQNASSQTRNRKDSRPVKKTDLAAKLPVIPGNDADAVKLNPQAEADAFRDKRMVKDLQDNANRSDLTKHRHEISATKEDKEDEDVDEEEAQGLVRFDQDPETTDVEVSDLSP